MRTYLFTAAARLALCVTLTACSQAPQPEAQAPAPPVEVFTPGDTAANPDGRPQRETVRSLERVIGDVYRFQNNAHMALVIETEDSVVLVDTINAEAADWLKAEVQTRFKKPISHILYSHAHWDHATGAKHIPEATVIGHVTADATIAAGGERAANIKSPDQTYEGKVNRLTVGGKAIEMHHVPNRHSEDMSYIYFPEEDLVFIVDVITLGALPFGALPWYEQSDLSSIFRKALSFDAETVVTGHGIIGTNDDVKALRTYVNQLRNRVKSRMEEGKTLEQIQADVKMNAYKDWDHFDRVAENIEGIYNALEAEGL